MDIMQEPVKSKTFEIGKLYCIKNYYLVVFLYESDAYDWFDSNAYADTIVNRHHTIKDYFDHYVGHNYRIINPGNAFMFLEKFMCEDKEINKILFGDKILLFSQRDDLEFEITE